MGRRSKRPVRCADKVSLAAGKPKAGKRRDAAGQNSIGRMISLVEAWNPRFLRSGLPRAARLLPARLPVRACLST